MRRTELVVIAAVLLVNVWLLGLMLLGRDLPATITQHISTRLSPSSRQGVEYTYRAHQEPEKDIPKVDLGRHGVDDHVGDGMNDGGEDTRKGNTQEKKISEAHEPSQQDVENWLSLLSQDGPSMTMEVEVWGESSQFVRITVFVVDWAARQQTQLCVNCGF
eukprot:m.63705 g.63705  ORF g.63705 m.63705 type:complete len:161 (+) comp11959_c0_seq9:38-520(+)